MYARINSDQLSNYNKNYGYFQICPFIQLFRQLFLCKYKCFTHYCADFYFADRRQEHPTNATIRCVITTIFKLMMYDISEKKFSVQVPKSEPSMIPIITNLFHQVLPFFKTLQILLPKLSVHAFVKFSHSVLYSYK